MQLVRISHSRCQEWDGTSFVLAPDNWSEDTINQKLDAAMNAYFEVLDALRQDQNGKPYPNLGFIDYKGNPDKTVREVQDEHKQKQDANKAWETEHNKRNSGFDSFLTDQGFTSIYSETSEVLVFEADWGHHHGTPIKYDTISNPHVTPQSVVNKERGERTRDEFYD